MPLQAQAMKRHGNKSILASYELSPADVMELGPNGILGLLTVEGGPTSHTAILARGMRVPAIAGMTDLLAQAREGETVIVDALRGCALLAPDGDDLEKYQEFRENYLAFENQNQNNPPPFRPPQRTALSLWLAQTWKTSPNWGH